MDGERHGDEPDGGGLFGDSHDGPVEPAPHASEAADDTPADRPDAPDLDDDALAEPPRRARWPWLVLGAVVIFLALIAWTKVVNSDAYCTRCHSMRPAATSASHSVHADVRCISCHRGQGIRGAIAYLPTAGRELIDQLTPLSIADGVMDPAPCSRCHELDFTSPLLREQHPTEGCDGCHGNTTHPPPAEDTVISQFDPHPDTWVQIHGREAVKSTAECATCHLPTSCMNTCHFRFGSSFPHPNDWIQEHGPAQLEQGADACTLCHPATFCASCHGTEIPHASDWIQQHWRELQNGYPTAPCLTCHAEADCTRCHALHTVHNQQRIYET